MTPDHIPFYVVKPGETDVLMIVMGIFLVFAPCLTFPGVEG